MPNKILVVDENMAASKVAENLLAQHFPGSDVLVAQRGSECFDRFHVAQPDLIVLNETMPDLDGEAICYRLLNDPLTAQVPVVVMATDGRGAEFEDRYRNVIKSLHKPISPEVLLDVMRTVLSVPKPAVNPAKSLLFYDPAKTVFGGNTAYFSVRSALHMAAADRLTGVLRFFVNRAPIELYVQQGKFIFATSRNVQIYCKDSPVILSGHSLGSICEAQFTQQATGCPIFLSLSLRGGFPHDDVVQITRDHGQRVFANLWTAGRVAFEFEDVAAFPDFVRNFPTATEDPDNWTLASLRHVKFENLLGAQRPDPAGSPAYTRKGYELIQRLKLNDSEARFATAINGAEPTQSIAKRVGIPLLDALLLVFRFQSLELIDYWNPGALTLGNAG